MAQMTGRIVVASSLGVALVSLLAGWILDRHAAAARWLYLLAAATGCIAALRYRSVRVRREYALLAAEGEAGAASSAFSLSMLREILDGDGAFRAYMFWLSLYGAGNLMMGAQLVVMFSDRLHLPGLVQIGVLTVLPLAITPLALPAWAALFDRGHIVAYRARQCWVLVGAVLVFTAAVLWRQPWLLWPGAVLYGISVSGANIGWNLGHNDFAPLGRVQHYMGVHVTLTGVRGLIAPPIGIACYQALEWWRPGWGVGSMLLPVALVTGGAIGFQKLAVPQPRQKA
jgi:MFS family permease